MFGYRLIIFQKYRILRQVILPAELQLVVLSWSKAIGRAQEDKNGAPRDRHKISLMKLYPMSPTGD